MRTFAPQARAHFTAHLFWSVTISRHTLVTGGAGFIGSHLAEALLARGDRVTVVDDESTGVLENLTTAEQSANFRYVRGSVADPDLVDEITRDVDQIYHLAAAVGVALIAENPIESIQRNIRPVEELLEAARRHQQRGRTQKIFLASSSEVYGKNPAPIWDEEAELVFGRTDRPRWSYGVAKAIDEFLALAYWRQYRLPVVVGRFFNVVGPRQRGEYGMVLPRLVDRALAGLSPIVHDDGQQVRCFAHVADVARWVMALMETPAAEGCVLNIGSDQPITIGGLAEKVIAAVDPGLKIEYQSYAEAYSQDFEDVRVRVPNIDKLRRTIDYQVRYDLDETIRQLIDWMRS